MKKFYVILIVLLMSISSNTSAQNNKVMSLASSFIDTVKSNSYSGVLVDWDSITPIFMEKSKKVKEVKDLLPLFKSVLELLHDEHSLVEYHEIDTSMTESFMVQLHQMAKTTDAEAGLPPKNYQSYIIDKKYAYINVPPVQFEQLKYIDTIGQQLEALDAKNPKAWIIDLTENSGGANYPMIWHFASLIDVDYSYSEVFNDGEEKKMSVVLQPIGKEAEQVYDILGLSPSKHPPVKLKNNNIPIVILASDYTASAAEAFLLHFKGQKNVTIIGQKTAGRTSSNQYYEIGRNFSIELTVSLLKERNGKIYQINEGITPDVIIPFDISNIKTTNQLLEAIDKNKPAYLEKAVEMLENRGEF